MSANKNNLKRRFYVPINTYLFETEGSSKDGLITVK